MTNATLQVDPILLREREIAYAVYTKKRTALKSYCRGRGYHNAIRTLSFAEKYHIGYRKDDKTPEFQHQIEICLYAMTLKGLRIDEEEKLIQLILLHDVVEDYNVSLTEIEKRFGKEVADDVEAISKIVNGVKKSEEAYYAGMRSRIRVILAKGCDRVHNVQTMRGVFSFKKQEQYILEVKTIFLPLLKYARDEAPEYCEAFNNIKHMLQSQIEWVEEMLAALRSNVKIDL